MQPLYDLTSYPIQGPKRGKSLLLLGLANDGPVNIPVPVTSPDVAKKMFGVEGSLYKSFMQAYETDSTILIYMMRVTGEHATCDLWGTTELGEEPTELLRLRAMSGGEAYNDMQVFIDSVDDTVELVFVFPSHTELEPMRYNLLEYDNINMLVKSINEDTRDNMSCVFATSKHLDLSPLALVPYNEMEAFVGGEDGMGVTKNELYIALEYSYSLLEGYYMDYVVPVDAKFDDTHPAAFYGSAVYGTHWYHSDRDYLSLQDMESEGKMVTFYKQLIDFCKRQIGFGCMTHGIIGMNSVDDPTDLEKHEYSYMTRLLEASGFRDRYGLSTFSNGEWSDSGYFISVVAGEQFYKAYADAEVFNEDEENLDNIPSTGSDPEYHDNIAVSYAAMLAGLRPDKTTTNEPIPGATRLRYQFSNDELYELSMMGIVVPRESVRKGIVIANGVTAGLYNHDMHSIANVRQVQLALSFLNEALDEFVGEPILPLIRQNTLQKVIGNVLNSLKEDGVLIDYRYNLEYDEIRGLGSLDVDLQTKDMVEYTSATARLSFAM